MEPHEIVRAGHGLLGRVLQEAYDRRSDSELRSAFIYRHARNIADLGDDLLFLETEGRSSGSSVIVRAMLESLFYLGAAVKRPDFAAEKVVAEAEEEIDRLEILSRFNSDSARPREFSDTISLLKNLANSIRQMHRVVSKKGFRIQVLDAARTAQMEEQYRQEYFLFSKHSHSTISGIIDREIGPNETIVLREALFIFVVAVALTVESLQTQEAQAHIDEATGLLQAGNTAFRDLGIES